MRTFDLIQIIHPKEKTYKTIMIVFSALIYFTLLPIIFTLLPIIFIALPFSLIILLIVLPVSFFLGWLFELFFKNQILGEAVKVTHEQYPEIHNSVLNFCSSTLINPNPEVFIYNSNGMLNAFAVKLFLKKYVFLTSEIVDLSLKDNNYDELNFVIGHELGHHAANHLSYFTKFLINPGKIIPFLGPAYSRACELTADRYGYVHCKNYNSSQNALVNLAHGSKQLSKITNIEAFEKQEYEINPFIGFLLKLSQYHPRLTKRVVELKAFSSIYKVSYENNVSSNNNSNLVNKDSKTLTIGRESNCKIIINDPTVSKLHAEIILENGNISIRDLSSTNGTFVNGIKITGTQFLKSNDIVKVGNSILGWQKYI